MITAQNINANRLGYNREWESSWFNDKNRVYLGTYRKYPENTPLAKGINKGQNQYEKLINQDTKDFIYKDLNIRNGTQVKNVRIFNPMRITKRYMQIFRTFGKSAGKLTKEELKIGSVIPKPKPMERGIHISSRIEKFKKKDIQNPWNEPPENASRKTNNDGYVIITKITKQAHYIVQENTYLNSQNPKEKKVIGRFTSTEDEVICPATGAFIKPKFVSARNIDGEPKTQNAAIFTYPCVINENNLGVRTPDVENYCKQPQVNSFFEQESAKQERRHSAWLKRVPHDPKDDL